MSLKLAGLPGENGRVVLNHAAQLTKLARVFAHEDVKGTILEVKHVRAVSLSILLILFSQTLASTDHQTAKTH